MACFYRLFKRLLVLIILFQLTFQSVFLLGAASAAAADNSTVNQESPSQGDFLVYSDLMRRASSGADKAKVSSELKTFLQAEKIRLKDLHVPYERQWRYFSLLEKQLDSLDTTTPGKFESIITTIRSWFSLNQDQAKPETTIKEPAQPGKFAFAPDNVRLTSATLDYLPAPAAAPAKSWWQNLWQKILDLFRANSAQAQNNNYLPTLADIQPDNAEVIINADISDLAAQLNYNPVKIFNYVRANITYEPYYGAKKGSVGCLIEKICNDVDTASLAIALLRAAGIPARYHKALAVAPVAALKEMLGVDEVKTVYFALATNKIPVSLVGGNNPSVGGTLDAANLESETQLAMEWTVPELFYDYDERGANIDNTVNLETLATATTTPALQNYLAAYPKKQWIPLEILIKNPLTHAKKEIVADTAGFDSQAFWYGFLQYQGGLSPMNKYRGDLLSATGKDVFTANYQSTKARSTVPNFDILPATLPYQFTVGTDNTGASITDERWSTLPDSRCEQVIITLKKSSNNSVVLTHNFFASEINNASVSLIYNGATQIDKDVIASYGGIAATPSSLVAITPSLTLAGANYTTANTLAIGDSLILDFQYQVKGQTISQNQKFSISGNEEGIYVMMSRLTSDANLDDPALDAATRASRILIQGNAALAREYLKHWQEQNDLLKKSLDYEYQTQFSRAVVTQNRILTPVGNVPTTFDFKGLSIDAAVYVSDYSSRGNYKSHRQDFRLLSSLEASYYEAGLFQDIAGLDAVSTVTGLQYAYANPGTYNVQIITSTNQSVIDSLNLTANTKANMHADVQSGKTIVTPDKFVTQGVWSGILYISLAPDWTGRYAIGEQVQNGGFTSEGYEILNVLIDGKQYAQFINRDIGHPDNFIYTDQTANTADKLCRISKATFLDIMNNENWQESYGLPCLKEQYAFGAHDHTLIMALNASKFKSVANGYDYWAKDSTLVSTFGVRYPGDGITFNKFYPYWGTFVYDKINNGLFSDKITGLGVYNPQQRVVHEVNDDMYRKYTDNGLVLGKYVPNLLGYPTNERSPAAEFQHGGRAGDYQQFTNGTMYFEDRTWPIANETYVVIGGVNDRHNSQGGTYGMGFPIGDPGIFAGDANSMIQSFENGKNIQGSLTTNSSVLSDTVQTISLTRTFDPDEFPQFLEGIADGFAEQDIIGLGITALEGVAIGKIIEKLTEIAIVKFGKTALVRSTIRFIPGLGWAVAGATISLAAIQNIPLYNACNADPNILVEGKRTAYYCGQLAVNIAVAVGVGIITGKIAGKLNQLGVGTESARLAKTRVENLIGKNNEQWINIKKLMIENSKTRTGFFQRISDLNLNDDQIRAILSRPNAQAFLFSEKYYKWSDFVGRLEREDIAQLSKSFNGMAKDDIKHVLLGKYNTATGLFEGDGLHSPATLKQAMDNGVADVWNTAKTFKYSKFEDIPVVNGVREAFISQNSGSPIYKTFFPDSWTNNDAISAIIESAQSNFSNPVTKNGVTIKINGQIRPNGTPRTGFPDFNFRP